MRDLNWEQLDKLGANENFGSVIGKLFLFKAITAEQANMLVRYGEMVGRFDRYHASPGLRRHMASPSYDRGFGSEDEIVRRTNDGTLPAYERRAKRALKHWKRVQTYVPLPLRHWLDEVCIWDHEIPELAYPELVRALGCLARVHGFKAPAREQKKQPTQAERAQHKAKVLVDHMLRMCRLEGMIPERFRLAHRKLEGDVGLMIYGKDTEGRDMPPQIAYVNPESILVEQLNMLITKACELQGWREAQSVSS